MKLWSNCQPYPLGLAVSKPEHLTGRGHDPPGIHHKYGVCPIMMQMHLNKKLVFLPLVTLLVGTDNQKLNDKRREYQCLNN